MSTLAEKVAAEIQRWYRIGYEQGKEDAVVHSRWVEYEESYADVKPPARQKCVCGHCGKASERPLGCYCKWCGAKMDAQETRKC